MSLDGVARLALSLPEAVEGERHGNRTWFVRGKGFAWERPFSKADIKRFGETRAAGRADPWRAGRRPEREGSGACR